MKRKSSGVSHRAFQGGWLTHAASTQGAVRQVVPGEVGGAPCSHQAGVWGHVRNEQDPVER